MNHFRGFRVRLSSSAISLLALLALSACHREPETQRVPPPVVQDSTVRFPAGSPQLALLHAEQVTQQRTETLRLPARVVWDETRTVRVFAPLAGRIVRLLAQPGEPVKAGAPLALIASPDLGQVQADARRADTDFALAEKNLARASALHEHGVIALKELQLAQAERDRAQAERERASARLKLYGASAQVNQEFALRSPIAGVVVERNANPGEEVRPDQAQPGSPALFVVTDPTRVWVQIDAPESAVPALHPGALLELGSPLLGGEGATARIDLVSDFFDPQTRTLRVRASADNRERRLKAEMYLTAELEVDRGAFVRVPANAILLHGKQQYVFVEDAAGVYRRQEVRAEEAGFGVMRVRKGLAGGERVVTEGGLLLMQLFGSARQ